MEKQFLADICRGIFIPGFLTRCKISSILLEARASSTCLLRAYTAGQSWSCKERQSGDLMHTYPTIVTCQRSSSLFAACSSLQARRRELQLQLLGSTWPAYREQRAIEGLVKSEVNGLSMRAAWPKLCCCTHPAKYDRSMPRLPNPHLPLHAAQHFGSRPMRLDG